MPTGSLRDVLLDAIEQAMRRYVEGSTSGTGETQWRIHDSLQNGEEVAWFTDRDFRDANLRRMNAGAALDAALAAIEASGTHVVLPVELQTPDPETGR